MPLSKTCTVCKNELPLADFHKSKRSKDGRNYRCKICDKKARAKYRQDNKERIKGITRNNNLKTKYGITYQQYSEIVKSQNNICPVCNKELDHSDTNKHKPNRACVDHCHITGVVRGVLCTMCNKGIGLLGDNLLGLESAVKYLKRSAINDF